MSDASHLLPEGTRLLHIGPPKTGTSALQSACHVCRKAMREQGVRYAGAAKQASTAAYAVTGRIHPSTGKPPSIRHWNSLAREVRGARESRVLISSEFFAGASDEQAAKIVRDLDAARVHIAITLRPLAKILASRWQQNVQEGARIKYEEWLHAVLDTPESDHGKRFWSRQRHDVLIRRWVNVAGADRVTVVIPDESDHDALLKSFESLLGLTNGTLVPQRDASNRSMTLEEVEAIRIFNEQFFAEHFSKALYYKVMSRGAAHLLKSRTPAKNEARLVTPSWARDKANTLGVEVASSIKALGLSVVGDVQGLVDRDVNTETGATTINVVEKISPALAAQVAIGVLLASGGARGERGAGLGRVGPTWGEPQELFRISTLELVGVIMRRVWAGGAESIAGLFGRNGPPRR